MDLWSLQQEADTTGIMSDQSTSHSLYATLSVTAAKQAYLLNASKLIFFLN